MSREKRPATLSRAQLDQALAEAVRHPHAHVHKGTLRLHPDVFADPGRGTNVLISRFALIDCTGSIEIGPWCNIGARSRIYTHDHIHLGREPLLALEEEHGVVWQDKRIGRDVWIHDGAMVLYQVTQIPDGVVVGAGAVLTKNPGPWEIWAGNPARKIGEREPAAADDLEELLNRPQFRLSSSFSAGPRNRAG